MEIKTVEILQSIVTKDPTIEIIEIWANVLYVRKTKGRNTFHSKCGITESQGIYLNILTFNKDEYKRLQIKYHPDKQPKYLYISKGINQWKELLLRRYEGKFNNELFRFIIDPCGQTRSFESFAESISDRWKQTPGLFNGFISSEELLKQQAEAARRHQEDLDWQRSRGEKRPAYDHKPEYPW